MEFNEDLQYDPISPEPKETPVSEAPEMPQEDTAWHGTGAGQQEYFTASPSDAWVDQQNVSEPVTEAAPEEAPETAPVSEPLYQRTYTPQPEQYTVPKKRTKKPGAGKKILAALLSAALVAGSCAVTAGVVNNRWEQELDRQQTQINAQLEQLQEQIQTLQELQTGVSVSGSPMASQGGMSPSQVYAMNVDAVVAISNQSTTNVWGQISETASSGTGFIISSDGYILSIYHVVEGAKKLTVITYMGD